MVRRESWWGREIPKHLAAGLQRLIEDPEAARKRAAGGLAKVSAEFDIADSAAAMASLLERAWSGTDRRAVGPAARCRPRRPMVIWQGFASYFSRCWARSTRGSDRRSRPRENRRGQWRGWR